jgi:tetratricopeptide (TPR) repeat protein
MDGMRCLLVLTVLLFAAPALAQPRAAARAAEIDAMITALKAAPSEQAAGQIEGRLRQLWTQTISPAALLLMNRGMRELNDNVPGEALDDLDAALVLDPDHPDGYHRRAMARATAGDYRGAIADIREALTREPRYFPALQTLSRIAEEGSDFKGALSAWRKAMEFSPRTPGGDERLKLLERKAYGEGT